MVRGAVFSIGTHKATIAEIIPHLGDEGQAFPILSRHWPGFDAAQERGEVAGDGQRRKAVPDQNSFSTTSELGFDAAQERGEVASHGGGRNFKISDGNVEPDGIIPPVNNSSHVSSENMRIEDLGPGAGVVGNNAKSRLADEYDAAQERGEVATGREGKGLGVARDNAQVSTAADLGLRRDQIHDARQVRAAETAMFTSKRKLAYEELHPETAAKAFKGNQHTKSGDGKVCHDQPSFADDQAEKTGKSSRTVRRDAERGVAA